MFDSLEIFKKSQTMHRSAVVLVILLFSGFCGQNSFASDVVAIPVETDNGQLSLQDLAGSVIYVDFWASWCAPCRKSFPWMSEMQQRYRDKGLQVIAVNLDKTRDLGEKFLAEVGADFTIAYDPQANLAEAFEIIGMPSAFVLNRQGEVVASHVGFREKKKPEYEKSIIDALEHD